MAMSTANLVDAAITEIQTKLMMRKRLVDLNVDQIMFIFGLEDEGKNADNQVHLQDAADWFEAKAWVARVSVIWNEATVRLFYKSS